MKNAFSKMEPHKTKKIRVGGKLVDVDILIIPLVKWLNKQRGITTAYSCQGDGENCYSPYVAFNCTEKVFRRLEETVCRYSLKHKDINTHTNTQTSIFNGKKETRFAVYFQDTESMLAFAKYVGA